MPIVDVARFPANRKDRNTGVRDETRRHIILGREQIGGAQRHPSAGGLESQHEVGRFRGDVETTTDAKAFERFGSRHAFANVQEHRHVGRCPGNLQLALSSQRRITDIRRHGRDGDPPSGWHGTHSDAHLNAPTYVS